MKSIDPENVGSAKASWILQIYQDVISSFIDIPMRIINPDELLEVTPDSLRLRKKYLDPNERKRMARAESA